MENNQSPPASFYLLFILILFQGLSGLLGGIMLVIDPSGGLLNMPIGLLSDSVFQNFMIPGIILLFLLGVFPTAVGIALWKRYSWSGPGAVITGIMLVIWIGVQIAIVGYQGDPPLQAVYGSVGVLILIALSTPAVRQYLQSRK